MGVWIETSPTCKVTAVKEVTPCVGVWIETRRIPDILTIVKSHPAWVCGLRLEIA